MARRYISMNELMEVFYRWHKGEKIKSISTSLGMDRKTVRKYINMIKSSGISQDFNEEELIEKLNRNIPTASYDRPKYNLLSLYKDQIRSWLEMPHMTGKQIWRLLRENYNIPVGYTTIKRYLKKEFSYHKNKVTIRIETPPGEEAQVDFGYAGLMYDPDTGRTRKTYVFIMTLSYSRHKYIRFVFRQDVNTWLDCHEKAFTFFGGVPRRIILDNLKSGVVKPDIYDPSINMAYGDMERYYGFIADPAKVRKPEHKGKIERAVSTVKKHLLAGRTFDNIHDANEKAHLWCREGIGMEIHGTTKKRPYETFVNEEKHTLMPLPDKPFERPLWKECKVHPDHHIVFDKSYYSLPTRYIGMKVWAKGTNNQVEIFLNYERIKLHPRAKSPGTWVTDPNDYPHEKLAFLMATPLWCRKRAGEIGPHTEELINTILRYSAIKNLRKAQAILRLADKYPHKMEKVAERAITYGNTRYKSIKAMMDMIDIPPKDITGFIRPPEYFMGEVP